MKHKTQVEIVRDRTDKDMWHLYMRNPNIYLFPVHMDILIDLLGGEMFRAVEEKYIAGGFAYVDLIFER